MDTDSQPDSPARALARSPLKIICFLFDPNTGGPTVRARAVYTRMVAAGDTVRLALVDREGSAAGYLAEAGLPVDKLAIPKPALPNKPWEFLKFCAGLPFGIWRVRRYLKDQRPDVVHINGAFDVIPAFGARLAGIPVVWHLNDTVFSPRISRILGGIVRRMAAQVVTAANRVAQHYGIPDDQRLTVHAPVDVDRFAPRDPADWPRPEPRLLLIGNWNWIKGQDKFIQVIANLRGKGLNVRGLVAGRFLDSQEAFWQPILQDLKARGLDQVVDTPGFVADTHAALCDSDILLLTSHSEASPIAVLEAMSVGIPQVVFDVGGVREMLGEGEDAAGVIVDRQDVVAMTAAVERILSNKDVYERLAKAGQARARAMFSAEICVAKHGQAYEAAIGKQKGRA